MSPVLYEQGSFFCSYHGIIIKFLVPIHSNGVDVIVHVSFYTDSELPEIELYPDIRNMQKADNDWFGCRTLLRASQKWLEGVLGESIEANGDVIIIRTPFVRISSCITYSHRDGCERGGHIEIAFE